MTPFLDDGDVRLYHGDALRIRTAVCAPSTDSVYVRRSADDVNGHVPSDEGRA